MVWKEEVSHNNKAKWIAKLKADYLASVIQQHPVTISDKDLRLRVHG